MSNAVSAAAAEHGQINKIIPHHHRLLLLFFFLLFIILSPLPSAAQTVNDEDYSAARFSPSMAAIVAVLVVTLFLMGIFSICIRNYSRNDANNVRLVTGGGRSRRGGTRGLDASVIETFPTMVYSEVKGHKIGKGTLECAVCLNEFEDDEKLRLIPKCDHVFHPDCIDAWLASHTTCPVCRANLVPQPGDSVSRLTGSNAPSAAEMDVEAQNDVVRGGDSGTEEETRRNCDDVEAQDVEGVDSNGILNRNRTRGLRSNRIRKLDFLRSKSTGHSLVQPGENTDRFTLRLPIEVRKQLMNRKLNRSTSLVLLPRERSSRQGYRSGDDGGSSRGKSLRRVFSLTRPFFNRTLSMKSPKVAANDGEGTSSSLLAGPVGDSSRPPV